MTRFSITLKESVNFVLNSLVLQKGGEIFVPKIPSYRLLDLCKAIDKKCKIKIIGTRPGEKVHEELISNLEAKNTLDLKLFYIILANYENQIKKINKKSRFVKKNFHYSSEKNDNFLNIKDLNEMIYKRKNLLILLKIFFHLIIRLPVKETINLLKYLINI
jgi:UDP-N-acetylglucosamine 4,6-dehydratase